MFLRKKWSIPLWELRDFLICSPVNSCLLYLSLISNTLYIFNLRGEVIYHSASHSFGLHTHRTAHMVPWQWDFLKLMSVCIWPLTPLLFFQVGTKVICTPIVWKEVGPDIDTDTRSVSSLLNSGFMTGIRSAQTTEIYTSPRQKLVTPFQNCSRSGI